MPNRSSDPLFQLIKSLEKAEKRNFKLFIRRNTAAEDLKVITLFDALDKMDDYDEDWMLKKHPSIKKQQLSNLKAHLYREILASLRLLKENDNIDLQLHELMDQARILYNKGLYLQSLRALSRLKELAKSYHQLTYRLQAQFFEKKIEALHITRSMQERAEELAQEMDQNLSQLTLVNDLSSLALELYSWYIQHGHCRNKAEEELLQHFFQAHLPAKAQMAKGFYEELYLYQCYTWMGFIKQDFLQYYRYCKRWTDLFHRYPEMLEVETAYYIKGIHNLMGAHFDLQNWQLLKETIESFEAFSTTAAVTRNTNHRISCFVYLNIAKINLHFIEGRFSDGLHLVPHIEQQLEELSTYLDRHRVLVFYYKIACLYFGSGDNEKAIDYLNKIIQGKNDLRTDLQSYARLLHLIAHFELGNDRLIEYLIKSVYRFMAKQENLSAVEELLFRFLRNSFHLHPSQIRSSFVDLAAQLAQLQSNSYETRAYLYLDVHSWLKSKIDKVPVQTVIRNRFLESEGKRKKMK